MKSKTSLFNGTLFRNTLRRYWPVWAAYAVIWVIAMPMSLSGRLSNAWETSTYIYTGWVLETAHIGSVVISALFGVFAAMACFNHLYSSKSSGMMASLPVRREGIFVTMFSVGLFGLIGVNAVIFIITLLVETAFNTVAVNYLLTWFAAICMSNIFFYGFAVLCAMLTGHILVLPLVYAVLNFTVAAVENIVRNLLPGFVYGISSGAGYKLSFLSPDYYLFQKMGVDSVYDTAGTVIGYTLRGLPALCAYCAAGIILSALALALYRRRRMETASDVVAVNALRPVFKYCMAAGCALVLGSLVYAAVFESGILNNIALLPPAGVAAMTASLLIGGFIGYFAADMLMKKSFAVFKGNWKGYFVFAAILLLLTVSLEADLLGFERAAPEAAAVERAVISVSGDETELSDPVSLAMLTQIHESVIENKGLHESELFDYAHFSDGCISRIGIRYSLTNGREMHREYRIFANDELLEDASSDAFAIQKIINTQSAIAQRKSLEIPVSAENVLESRIFYYNAETGEYEEVKLTKEQTVELYETCLTPDMADCTLGRIWLFTGEEYENSVLDCEINFTLMRKTNRPVSGEQISAYKGYHEKAEYESEDFYTYPTVSSFRTNAFLNSIGIFPVTRYESREILQESECQDKTIYG